MERFILDLSILLLTTAVLSYLAIIFKQPIIIAYVLSGILIGPWGLGWIQNVEFIETISHLGITLLLFLAGLCLHPQKLIKLFRKVSLVAFVNCLVSFLIAALFAFAFHFSIIDSLCIGLALMFSSTILVVKLLPTTDLHQRRMGEVCIGILVLEDLLAIAVLAFIRCLNAPDGAILSFTILSFKLVVFIGILLIVEYYILRKVLLSIERLHEALLVMGLAWCCGLAMISNSMGLFYETGAFFAGVVLARHPIARFISDQLKPLRDFFLVLFFFTLGAKFDLLVMKNILFPGVILAVIFIFMKPWVFKQAFVFIGEKISFAKETGIRLGQLSEFSLLVAILALELNHISMEAAQLIQLVTILTFIASSYIVVYKYQTPIGISAKMTRD